MPVSLTRNEVAPKSVRDRITRYLADGLPKPIEFASFDWSTGKGRIVDSIQRMHLRLEAMKKMPESDRRAGIIWANWLYFRKKLFQALRRGMWRIVTFQGQVVGAGVMPFYLDQHSVISTPDNGFICFETGGIVAVILGEKRSVLLGPFCERCHPEEFTAFIAEYGTLYPTRSAIQKTA